MSRLKDILHMLWGFIGGGLAFLLIQDSILPSFTPLNVPRIVWTITENVVTYFSFLIGPAWAYATWRDMKKW